MRPRHPVRPRVSIDAHRPFDEDGPTPHRVTRVADNGAHDSPAETRPGPGDQNSPPVRSMRKCLVAASRSGLRPFAFHLAVSISSAATAAVCLDFAGLRLAVHPGLLHCVPDGIDSAPTTQPGTEACATMNCDSNAQLPSHLWSQAHRGARTPQLCRGLPKTRPEQSPYRLRRE